MHIQHTQHTHTHSLVRATNIYLTKLIPCLASSNSIVNEFVPLPPPPHIQSSKFHGVPARAVKTEIKMKNLCYVLYSYIHHLFGIMSTHV